LGKAAPASCALPLGFGGKSRAAPLIWQRFGDVANYVEPFAGSLAVLLGRPTPPRIETVNDLDCFVANFWRAVQHDPEAVAEYADWSVNEADLHARHQRLIDRVAFRERVKVEPEYYDAKVAGWWVWGLCQWIGSGWCRVPHKKLPHLGSAGMGVHSAAALSAFTDLADRLRRVRVCCGDWTRVLGPSPTSKLGVTGILLDPPYADSAGREAGLYAEDSLDVAHAVRVWAIEHGDDPLLRIALCGYEGEHEMPSSWECVAWKAAGGYGSQRADKTNENARRERVWFSPYCDRGAQGSLL